MVISRRQLLRMMAACSAMPFAGRLAPAHASSGDYKALICIFLFGGNDSFNTLVPSQSGEYAAYKASRGNMAVAQADLHGNDWADQAGRRVALHKSMPHLNQLLLDGRAAIVSNVGPVMPAASNGFPYGVPRLFSHNDQQMQWMTAAYDRRLEKGWAGKLGDILSNPGGLPLNYTVDGNNILQLGNSSSPFIMSSINGISSYVNFYNANWPNEVSRRAAFERILAEQYPRGTAEYAAGLQRSMRLSRTLGDAFALSANIYDSLFQGGAHGALSRQLLQVVRLLHAQSALNMSRQIFFVSLGGFDTHDHQLYKHPLLLGQLDAALQGLTQALDAMGLADKVTTFTASEFGRSLVSNGDGTDHGWGGHHFVIGDAVRPGLYGQLPDLTLGSPDDVGGGRIIPSLPTEQYFTALLEWFGISKVGLETIFPSLAASNVVTDFNSFMFC
ncbi:hypothetical protein DMO17_18655 [Aquipseudomonas alcaligenes]|uniref:DUF1501 domain-containing protein n=1 Tax=Aquipseudomonas alcaligenes TaxID=43263 RepID=A0A2V4KJQ5_AQUAC|nr:DUF1501 domain-containing protein [Pseudomonas alcaligenes]PYC20219.1 hypothetical protein DMO17_18655 [Pseudomonas alcaligenes]